MKRPKTPPKSDPLTLIDLAPYLPFARSGDEAAKQKDTKAKEAASKEVMSKEPMPTESKSTEAKVKPASSEQPTLILDPPRKSLARPEPSRRDGSATVPPGSPPRRVRRSPTVLPATAAQAPGEAVSPDQIPEWLKERAKVLEARAHRRRSRMLLPEDTPLYAEIELPPALTRAVARISALVIFALCGAIIFTLRWENVDLWDPLESTCRHASLSIL